MKVVRFPVLVLVVLFALVLAACAPEAAAPVQMMEEPAAAEESMEEPAAEEEMPVEEAAPVEPTIVDAAIAGEQFSTLVAAVVAAGLVDTLSSEGPYTVFAPTNDAFEAAFEALGITAEELLADTDLLTSVLLYHVVPGKLMAADVLEQNLLTMVDGNFALAYATDEGAFINDAPISMTDIEVSNGVIHVIDAVILPPAYETDATQSIVEIAAADEQFSTLVAAVEAAGLAETLSGEGPFTVFAPTNAAFEAAFEALGITAEELLADTDLLTSILLYHVTIGARTAEDVTGREGIPMLNGQVAPVEVGEAGASIAGAPIAVVDIEASNGIIHVIDAVMVPAVDDEMAEKGQSIVEIAAADGRFTTLVAAVEAAGLAETLSGDGPFTVFAPTDDAFAAAFEALGISAEELLADTSLLTDILLYHVASGELMAADVVASDSVQTLLEGGSLSVTVESDGSVTINDARVLITDIEASNGVIHVIDAVLVPGS